MVIGFVTKLVKTITFKRVLLWTLAGTIGIIGFTAYEHRDELFSATSLRQVPTGNPVGHAFIVGQDTKDKIKALTKSDPSIVGIGVLSADIRLNVRRSIYFYSAADNQDDSDPLGRYAQIQRLPLFTKNEENNRQMVKLINGEFHCVPYTQTTLAKAAPNINQDVVTICRASLPPYYGFFSGFVSVMLRIDPDVETQIRLRTTIESLATEIYFRDVLPTSKKSDL